METILKLENVHKWYGKKEVLKGIDLEVQKGEIISVLGPSGCGKSTLLNIIAGILPIEEGSVSLNNLVVTDKKRLMPIEKRNLNMVFQDYALWPHMTAEQNILYGLKLRKADKETCNKKLEELANLLHLNGLMQQYPSELSGGQQQRVAIARALIMDPSIILLDEPLCNLDVQLRIEMRTEMAEIFHTLHTTVFHVTHDPSEAFAMADRIVVLNGGKIDQIGTPVECYESPASEVVAGLLGAGNTIDATVISSERNKAIVEVANRHISVKWDNSELKNAKLRFRPEEVKFVENEEEECVPCSIVLPTFEGGCYRIAAEIEGTEVTFVSDHKIEKGTKGFLKFREDKIYGYGSN